MRHANAQAKERTNHGKTRVRVQPAIETEAQKRRQRRTPFRST